MSKEKWVLVTGGTRGIGEEIVKKLASAGFRVVFTYKNSDARASEIVRGIVSDGLLCEGYRCDVSKIKEIGGLAERLIGLYGAPYALINSAGITRDSILINMDHDQWSDVIDTNLNSLFYILKSFVKSMVMQGGCIINISSVSAIKANPGQVNYAATKGAVIAMTNTLAREMGRFNVRVNSVAPGLVETDMTSKIDKRSMAEMAKNIPLGRIGNVQDIAPMVLFLLGEGASYITGQTFVIDGGFTA